MRIPFLFLVTQALFLCSHSALSFEEQIEAGEIDGNAIRKQSDQNNQITHETESEIRTGRQYLEKLWDSLDKNSNRKLGEGRMRYLESMVDTLHRNLETPTKQPTSPTPAPTKGPTLPTRQPIPTRPPTPIPTTAKPTNVVTPAPTPRPTFRPIVGSFVPTGPCSIENKDDFLLAVLSGVITTDTSGVPFKDTPQGKAAAFLREESPSFACSPTLIQRFGLATLYFSTRGDRWTNKNGWLEGTHECNWYGVDCNKDKLATGLILRKYTRRYSNSIFLRS